MLDFNNTEIAFSAKSQSELKNAYLLFNTIKYPWLVKCASVVSNIALNIHIPLGWSIAFVQSCKVSPPTNCLYKVGLTAHPNGI